MTLNLNYDITNWLRVTVGYNCLYWAQVVRPGALINRSVDPVQVPTDANYNQSVQGSSPGFSFQEKSFWLQGINAGLLITY